MKVICIDNKNPEHPARIFPKDWIEEGQVYTVRLEWEVIGHGIYYLLEEKCKDGREVLYNSRRFVPLGEVDEMADVAQEQMEKQDSTRQ